MRWGLRGRGGEEGDKSRGQGESGMHKGVGLLYISKTLTVAETTMQISGCFRGQLWGGGTHRSCG